MTTPRVIVAYGTMEITKAVAYARRAVARGEDTLVLGMTRYQAYQGRKAWLVCLSWQGEPPIWVSAHRFRRDAKWQLLRTLEAAQQKDMTSDTTRMELLNELAQHGDWDLAHRLVPGHARLEP